MDWGYLKQKNTKEVSNICWRALRYCEANSAERICFAYILRQNNSTQEFKDYVQVKLLSSNDGQWLRFDFKILCTMW